MIAGLLISVVEEFMKRFDFILTKIIFSFFADGVSQRSLTLWQMQPLDHLSCLEKLSNGVGKQLFLFLQAPMSTYLWAVLSANTPPNTWRAATNDKGWVAASHTITDQKGAKVFQQVASNAFQATPVVLTAVDEAAPSSKIAFSSILFLTISDSEMPFFSEETLMKMKNQEL
jgi:hypothetical protein